MVFANFFLLLSCLCIRLVYIYICPQSLARVHDISSHNANALTTLLSLLGSNLFQSNLIPSASISIYICIYYISTCLSINQSIYIVSILYLSCLIYPFYLTYGHRPHWTPLPVSLSLSRHLSFQPGGQQLLITSAKYVKRLWRLYVLVHLATHGDLTWFWCNKSGCTKKISTNVLKKHWDFTNKNEYAWWLNNDFTYVISLDVT